MLNASVNRRPLTRSSRVVTFVALLGLTVLIAGLGAQSFFTLSGTVSIPRTASFPTQSWS